MRGQYGTGSYQLQESTKNELMEMGSEDERSVWHRIISTSRFLVSAKLTFRFYHHIVVTLPIFYRRLCTLQGFINNACHLPLLFNYSPD
jgi:hypothetical protein